MKKAQLPLIAELNLGHTEEFTTKSSSDKFSGTDNPRHLRTLFALMTRPRRREEIDQIAGSSNGPDLISDLRRRGLHIDCQRTPGIDRDGLPVLHGVYSLDEPDRRKLAAWLRQREGAKP